MIISLLLFDCCVFNVLEHNKVYKTRTIQAWAKGSLADGFDSVWLLCV